MMEIPFLDLKRAYARYGEEIEKAVIKVLRKGVYLNGEETKALERELASYLGRRYAIGVSSGTEALYLILKALSLPKGSAILLPSFTFVATAEVVVRAGLRPIFVDVERESGNMSLPYLEKAYDEAKKKGYKVSGVIVVSIFGIPARLDEISEFCKNKGLYLIEDICQAFGSELSGRKVGTFGVASATSFYPTKNLSACGDAGMVFTDDEKLAKKIEAMKEHGQTKPYYYEYHGVNGRIDEIQCAILRTKFKYFEEEGKLRENIAKLYSENLKDLFPIVKLLHSPPNSRPLFSLFSIRVKKRDELMDFLKKSGIQTRVYYPQPLHLQPIYKRFGYKRGALPETEALCEEILSLPFYPYLREEEVWAVIEKIREFYKI
ncbi:MAG: DegT/DnrJ/EryC1/StrS family aminotransferase [Caldimicrobium thiodismutans]|uniref:DegT/DnrJ/EryC1/StrS family aminotransferase n=1 Tax=Caldimicrobium thiodismutans TaxID=1653476 RepID=A0A2N7PJD9_9BACT|nr:MAG: DegT/DnrJ/EryC1/StrS family aminotransferase [Caldimicrobium thiodismutans]